MTPSSPELSRPPAATPKGLAVPDDMMAPHKITPNSLNDYMEAMRGVDREFTMRAWDPITGVHLRHSLCVLKASTPQLDPMGEFTGC